MSFSYAQTACWKMVLYTVGWALPYQTTDKTISYDMTVDKSMLDSSPIETPSNAPGLGQFGSRG